jgi:photosystem II stability/assembly factor-like uncharacterized protein
VHALVSDPSDPDTIWRQDHMGVFRTKNGGDSWERIESGLPAGRVGGGTAPGSFGFALAMDRRSKALFAVPLESDEYRMPHGGALRVYRSRNGGDSWGPASKGLPDGAFVGVLRTSMAADDAGGVYFGTTSGTVYASRDAGDTWQALPGTYPRILCVAAFAE